MSAFQNDSSQESTQRPSSVTFLDINGIDTTKPARNKVAVFTVNSKFTGNSPHDAMSGFSVPKSSLLSSTGFSHTGGFNLTSSIYSSENFSPHSNHHGGSALSSSQTHSTANTLININTHHDSASSTGHSEEENRLLSQRLPIAFQTQEEMTGDDAGHLTSRRSRKPAGMNSKSDVPPIPVFTDSYLLGFPLSLQLQSLWSSLGELRSTISSVLSLTSNALHINSSESKSFNLKSIISLTSLSQLRYLFVSDSEPGFPTGSIFALSPHIFQWLPVLISLKLFYVLLFTCLALVMRQADYVNAMFHVSFDCVIYFAVLYGLSFAFYGPATDPQTTKKKSGLGSLSFGFLRLPTLAAFCVICCAVFVAAMQILESIHALNSDGHGHGHGHATQPQEHHDHSDHGGHNEHQSDASRHIRNSHSFQLGTPSFDTHNDEHAHMHFEKIAELAIHVGKVFLTLHISLLIVLADLVVLWKLFPVSQWDFVKQTTQQFLQKLPSRLAGRRRDPGVPQTVAEASQQRMYQQIQQSIHLLPLLHALFIHAFVDLLSRGRTLVLHCLELLSFGVPFPALLYPIVVVSLALFLTKTAILDFCGTIAQTSPPQSDEKLDLFLHELSTISVSLPSNSSKNTKASSSFSSTPTTPPLIGMHSIKLWSLTPFVVSGDIQLYVTSQEMVQSSLVAASGLNQGDTYQDSKMKQIALRSSIHAMVTKLLNKYWGSNHSIAIQIIDERTINSFVSKKIGILIDS